MLGVLAYEDRQRLAKRATHRRFRAGAIVYAEGEPSDSLLVVEVGQLKVSTYSADGAEFIFARMLPGETLGELGVLTGSPRSATVTAVTDCQVLVIGRTVVTELLVAEPAVAAALLGLLARKLQRLTDVTSDLVFLDLPRRLAKFLLRLEEGGAPSSQAELAASVGASRQRVSACLAEFRRRGWVTTEGRRVTVADPAALRGYIAGDGPCLSPR